MRPRRLPPLYLLYFLTFHDRTIQIFSCKQKPASKSNEIISRIRWPLTRNPSSFAALPPRSARPTPKYSDGPPWDPRALTHQNQQRSQHRKPHTHASMPGPRGKVRFHRSNIPGVEKLTFSGSTMLIWALLVHELCRQVATVRIEESC